MARRTSEPGAPRSNLPPPSTGVAPLPERREREKENGGRGRQRGRDRGRESERGVTHRLWILMTRAMNSDRAKGGTAAVNPPFFPSLVFGIHSSLSSASLFFAVRSCSSFFLPRLLFSFSPSNLSITFSLFLEPGSGKGSGNCGYVLCIEHAAASLRPFGGLVRRAPRLRRKSDRVNAFRVTDGLARLSRNDHQRDADDRLPMIIYTMNLDILNFSKFLRISMRKDPTTRLFEVERLFIRLE